MMKKITLFISLFFIFPMSFFGQSTATYDITFNSIWNATDHTSIPPGAHWSKLVGATHKTANTFLEIGGLATTGIKNVAEFGSNSVFNSEVNTAISNGEADQYINGPALATATGDAIISDLEVKEAFPLLTLVSMIAPSPDWIIAVNGLNLLDGNADWVNNMTIDLFAYDAGTDSGTDYTSGNVITNPFQPISMITGGQINGNKIGTLSITLKSVLNTESFNPIRNVRVYPNPSNGEVTLSNLQNTNLKKIEVYNILGAKVFSKNDLSNINTVPLNLKNLNKGIYLLKMISDENKVKTQKLVIQ